MRAAFESRFVSLEQRVADLQQMQIAFLAPFQQSVANQASLAESVKELSRTQAVLRDAVQDLKAMQSDSACPHRDLPKASRQGDDLPEHPPSSDDLPEHPTSSGDNSQQGLAERLDEVQVSRGRAQPSLQQPPPPATVVMVQAGGVEAADGHEWDEHAYDATDVSDEECIQGPTYELAGWLAHHNDSDITTELTRLHDIPASARTQATQVMNWDRDSDIAAALADMILNHRCDIPQPRLERLRMLWDQLHTDRMQSTRSRWLQLVRQFLDSAAACVQDSEQHST